MNLIYSNSDKKSESRIIQITGMARKDLHANKSVKSFNPLKIRDSDKII